VWLDKGGTISLADTDPLTDSIWNWRNIAGNITRMFTDDMANSGVHKKVDLMNAKIENLRLSLIDVLETQLFTAQSGQTMSGLPDIVEANLPASQSKTPGGLSKSTYPWWRNQYFVSTGSAAAYLKSDMRTMYNNCSVGNDHPNLLLTEQTVFEFYEAEAEDIQRINDSSDAFLGFQAFKYKGANLYYSPLCPTVYM
jgi:hypothetical protein